MRVLTGHNFLQGGHILAGHGLSSGGALSAYAVAGVLPSYVMDTEAGVYYDGTYYDGPNQLHDHATTSNRTVVDSDGLIKWAPHNSLARSEDFDSPTWVKTNTTVTANAVFETTATGEHNVYQTFAGGPQQTVGVYVKPGLRQNFVIRQNISSVWRNANFVLSGDGSVGTTTGFDDATITNVGGGWYYCTATSTNRTDSKVVFITSTGDEVISFAGDDSSAAIHLTRARLYRSDLGGMQSTGNSVDPTYVPTSGSAVYWAGIDYDPVTGEVLGLQGEPAATNLFADSNQFTPVGSLSWRSNTNCTITSNSATSPGGTTNASLVTLSGGAVPHKVDHTSGLSDDPQTATDCLSWFVKAGTGQYVQLVQEWSTNWCYAVFDLINGTVTETGANGTGTHTASGIEDYGNGWYRIWMAGSIGTSGNDAQVLYFLGTGTPGGINNAFNSNGTTYYIYGAQFEADKSVPTSYIPSNGATTTRAALNVSKPTSEISSDLDELLVVAEWQSTATDADAVIAALDNAGTDLIHLRAHADNANLFVQDGGVTQADVDAGAISANTQYRAAFKMAADDFLASLGGATAVADTSGTMPTPTTLRLFNSNGAAALAGIRIRKLIIYGGAPGALDAITDAVVEETAQPSEVPSLQLIFDDSGSSFTDTGLTI